MTLDIDILEMMDKQVLQERRRNLEEMNSFRKKCQQPHQQRDYDLYDPLSLKKDRPARISDIDPLCGASSGQQFEGEDLGQKKRNELQQEQMRVWTNSIKITLNYSSNLRKRS